MAKVGKKLYQHCWWTFFWKNSFDKYFSKKSDKKVWLYKHKSGHSWDIDDIEVAEEIWGFFSQFLSTNNSSITFLNNKKFLLKKLDLLGRDAINKGFQLHIYNDGSVEKKYVIK